MKRPIDPCQEPGCTGLNPDGTCPNGYGVTCAFVFPEPSNMADDPLRKPSAANGRDVPVCENCQRIVAPKVYAVTVLLDGGMIGQRRLCRACLTHVTDRLTEEAPWLGTRLGAVR